MSNQNSVAKSWIQKSIEQLTTGDHSVDSHTMSVVNEILSDVRSNGESVVRRISENFGDIETDAPLVLEREQLLKALESIDPQTRSLLERTATRIRTFAEAQRRSFSDCSLPIPGGTVAHRWIPLETAGCYAPGGRYPLPSSVLMTAVTARVAGVRQVWVASPKPTIETIAAAAVAGADGLLCVGGAQAIGSFAFGLGNIVPSVDVIVGPGNRFVTAAKAIVSRTTRIDMLAGPSEIVIVASGDADERLVAADLLAQAEHDTDARPILITDDQSFAVKVQQELTTQLETLPTADVARIALENGGYHVVESVAAAIHVCKQIGPEHLSLQGEKITSAAEQFTCGSALFIGNVSAEVIGDYGAGPNHVLPTGGRARSESGLSVATFMRMQTQLHIENAHEAAPLINDAVELAYIEGLEAHARSAALRIRS